jgi:hypothetical protein
MPFVLVSKIGPHDMRATEANEVYDTFYWEGIGCGSREEPDEDLRRGPLQPVRTPYGERVLQPVPESSRRDTSPSRVGTRLARGTRTKRGSR